MTNGSFWNSQAFARVVREEIAGREEALIWKKFVPLKLMTCAWVDDDPAAAASSKTNCPLASGMIPLKTLFVPPRPLR